MIICHGLQSELSQMLGKQSERVFNLFRFKDYVWKRLLYAE